jgi:hypothetical protein
VAWLTQEESLSLSSLTYQIMANSIKQKMADAEFEPDAEALTTAVIRGLTLRVAVPGIKHSLLTDMKAVALAQDLIKQMNKVLADYAPGCSIAMSSPEDFQVDYP